MKTRSFQLRARAETLGDRRVRFVASTADLDTWGSIVHPRGCRLDRFKAAGSLPLLWNHNRDNPEDVLGKVVAVEVSDDAVVCDAEFRQSPRADEVLGLVLDGTIRGCSIGFCDEVTQTGEGGVFHVVEWTLAELSVCPVGANPKALAIRSFTVSTSRGRTFQTRRAAPETPTRSPAKMDPKKILEKLGVSEGSKPEEIAAALIKYLAGADSDADKAALVVGLLGMLAPAPSGSSASDGAKAAAAEAMADEVKKLQARIDELETKRAEADKAKEETPEQRADAAIKRGQWPLGQRAALVSQYAAKKEPFLFAEGAFSTRSERITVGGAAKPTIEAPSAKTSGVKAMFEAVEGQLAANRAND